MSFKIGIVGLPNVGKSTLFKALTKKQVLIANYPFATIDPNVGVVEVPDERLEKLAEVLKPKKIIPTVIEFYDIAGLVKGAYKGEGLGNQFLSHIREVDAIAHIVRAFTDPNVSHIHSTVDPKNDIEIINLELCMADLKTVGKRYDEVSAKAKSGDTEAIKMKELLGRVKDGLNQGRWAREIVTEDDEKAALRDLHLLTMKPMLYVLNIDEIQKNVAPGFIPGFGRAQGPALSYVLIFAKIESELAELAEAEAKEMRQLLNLQELGLDQFIKASYKLLNLITFFTTQSNILQAWTVRQGAKAPQAAGVIHTDFEKGFIQAEVINWQDFVECGSEAGAKEKGLMRLEGKDYEVQDGDICYFRVAT